MRKAISCIAAAMMLLPAGSWADCVDGSRAVTAQEKEFRRKLSESLKSALPAAPAPLWLENEPEVILSTVCGDTDAGTLGGLVMANYTASLNYSDRVKLTIRANYDYPGKDDLVLGAVPIKPAGLKVQNLVVAVDGYNAQYMAAVKQAVDRARLQAMIDKPLPEHAAAPEWRVGNAAAAPAATQASDATPAAAAGSPPSATPQQPESNPAKTDVAEKAKDTVKKLRGLLGQ